MINLKWDFDELTNDLIKNDSIPTFRLFLSQVVQMEDDDSREYVEHVNSLIMSFDFRERLTDFVINYYKPDINKLVDFEKEPEAIEDPFSYVRNNFLEEKDIAVRSIKMYSPALINFLDKLATEKDFYVDQRIVCHQTPTEIYNFFIKDLNKQNYEDGYLSKIILSEDDVQLFLNRTFQGFPVNNSEKKIKANCTQKLLRQSIRKFYEEYSYSRLHANKYCKALQDNFSNFDKTSLDTIKKEFSR